MNETLDGKKLYALRHYFMTDDGSYLYTENKSVHVLLIEGAVYYAQTEYSVVEAGGKFERMTGSFKSWGAMDYSKGVGVLRFEGQINR